MEFLASIGGLALIGLVVYAFVMHLSKTESEKIIHNEILKNSYTANNLVDKHKKSKLQGKQVMTEFELQKKLNKIAKKPEEKESYLNKIKRENEREEENKQRLIDYRIFGYKYDTDIFKIFDTNRELSASELVSKTQEYYNINIDEARDLIKTWHNHLLINYCVWGHYKLEVGMILMSEQYKLGSNDLTRNEWLVKNSKVLKEKSEAEKIFYNI